MASLLFTSTAIQHLCSNLKAQAFSQYKDLSFSSSVTIRRKKIQRKRPTSGGLYCKYSIENRVGGGSKHPVLYSSRSSQAEVEKRKTIFPGGLKRADMKLPGLVLRVTANEVLNEGQSASILKVIDSAVLMSKDGFFTMVFLDASESGGGQLYEAALVLKTLLRSRAHLLVAERVDIAAAAGATGVVLSDEDLPAIIARNMMQSAQSESSFIPLVARTVRTAESAQNATATEGADLLMLVIENQKDAEMLVGSVCQHVSIPVFVMFDSLKESALASLTYNLVKAGASGIVLSAENVTYLGDDILKEVKTLLFSIKLTDQSSKKYVAEDFSETNMVNNNISSNATKAMEMEKSLDIEAKEVLDEERPLLLKTINIVREAAPWMEEVSLLVDAVAQLDELFLLVIVGEFNSGKSTVINAMLGKRYMKEGVIPTTNEITLLCYSGEGYDDEERSEKHPDGHFIRYLPASLLKQICFVDTPGTNVILKRQQRLTEEFVPRADLVLFVISADRPLTESEVTFLRYIRQWGKKVIFILNKSDIFKDVKESEEAVRFVKDNAQQLLSVDQITLYPVSSRNALEAKIAATREDGKIDLHILSKDPKWIYSGFSELENYIFSFLDASTNMGAERVRLKLETPIGISTALLGATEEHIITESAKANAQLMTIKENIVKLKQYRQLMENDSISWRKRILSVIEDANKCTEKIIDSILRISNVEVAAEYILKGDRPGSIPVISSFENEVIDSALLDIRSLLGKYWTWLRSNNAQQERRFREIFEDEWPSLVNSGKLNTEIEKKTEEQIQRAHSMEVLEEFNVKAAAILFEQEIREVVIETFGGLGVAGFSASILTSILPTTVEDLMALGLCSAGGFYGVWKLPQRRLEVKSKVQRTANSFARQLDEAMQEDLAQAMRDAEHQVDLISKPYEHAAELKANRLNGLLVEIKHVGRKLQLLQFRIQNFRVS